MRTCRATPSGYEKGKPCDAALRDQRQGNGSPIGDAAGKSIANWEGSALMINTIVNDPHRGYTQMDRWKMSRDGRMLTIRRQIVSLQGEVESTLVYEKQ